MAVPIQSQTNNLLYTTGGQNAVTDYKTNVPDFTGMPLVSLTSKKSSSSVTTTVQTTLTYDPVHRITAVDQSYNGTSTVHVAQYVYNELGQLVQKKLGETSTSWLQLVDFRYNIRGQLTNINNSTLTDNGQTDDDPSPVFGMTLLYDQQDSNLGNSSYHSGRLSAIKWMSKDGSNNSSYERAFTYNYDAAARYTAANYKERNGSGSFTATHGWDEQITAYDENGNIKTLTRNAATQGSGTYTAVDNLTYTYQTNNANQLYTVTDATNNQTGFGIQTGGNSSGHYVYDPNGNLTSDPYKDLSIGYNSINKTDKITMLAYTGRYEYYVYDATGTVMEKQQWDNNALVHTTVYTDGFVYTDGTLTYITTPEGRADYNGSTFTNEYIISDQQGNARISFNNTGSGGAREVIQENSYYGYGMVMPGSAVGLPTNPNKNLYNGQSEWQNDYSNMPDYYQTPGRNYDAEIGRFISADPMPESAMDMSTYHYAGDNPIMMNDPSGNNAAPNYAQSGGLNWTKSIQDDQSLQMNPAYNPGLGEGGGSVDPLADQLIENASETSEALENQNNYAENEAVYSIVLTKLGLSLDYSAKQYTVNSYGVLNMVGDVTDGNTQGELTSLMTRDEIGVNSGILAQLDLVNRGESSATFREDDDGEPLFNFLARNTLVEFSRCVYTSGDGQNWTLISTGHQFFGDPQSGNEARGLINSGDEILEFDHSHPNTPPEPQVWKDHPDISQIQAHLLTLIFLANCLETENL